MSRNFVRFFTIPALFSVCVSAVAESSKTFTLDPVQSSIQWIGRKVTGSHHGTIRVREGSVQIRDGTLIGGTAAFDMSSIAVDDIKDPKDNAKLTGHLKSDDFFSVATFPATTFAITSVEPLAATGPDAPNVTIIGTLAITGLSHPISFPARIQVQDAVASAKGSVSVDRTVWNIRYGSGKFFENLGDRMIKDDFQIDFSLVARAQK